MDSRPCRQFYQKISAYEYCPGAHHQHSYDALWLSVSLLGHRNRFGQGRVLCF